MSLKQAYELLDAMYDLLQDADLRTECLQAAGDMAGDKMNEILEEYPEASGKELAVWYTRERKDGTTFKSKFKTQRQQGKVFSLIAEGKVPYRRQGRLGANITREAIVDGRKVTVKAGTNTPYADYVIGPKQSHYHMGTWEQFQAKVDKHKAEILEVFSNTLIRAIRDKIRGRVK